MRLDELTRADFPILQRIINGHPLVYFDSGASSQKPRAVLEAMNRYYERSHANVHRSIHASSAPRAARRSSSPGVPPTASG